MIAGMGHIRYAVFIICSFLAVGLVRASSRSWDEFKIKYNRKYSSLEEEIARRTIFEQNLREIERLNEETLTHSHAINHLADLTFEEIKVRNGFKIRREIIDRARKESSESDFVKDLLHDGPVPKQVNWRQLGATGRVKDQGHCGSCWAFATTGLLEGQEFLNGTRKEVVLLSEQNLIDCDDSNFGCAGGNQIEALKFIRTEGGLERETDYEYVSGDGHDNQTCAFAKSKAYVTTREIGKIYTLANRSEEDLKKIVARYGPVAAVIDANTWSFMFYNGGFYYGQLCSQEDVNHSVLIAGYGVHAEHGDYWLVKNSWGPAWGEGGYIRMSRNRGNNCGIATMPVFVDVAKE